MLLCKKVVPAAVLALGGILIGCQQTPPANTVVVPDKTPAPQTTEKTTTTQTETKETPAATNPDGSTTPQTTTTQKSTTVEKKQQ
jgi:hypothetical protein